MSPRCPAARRSTCRPGPSELMVIADDSADPALVAADLLSQAEHDAVGAGAARHDLAGAGRRGRARASRRRPATCPARDIARGVARQCAGSSSPTTSTRRSRSPISMRPSISRSRSTIPSRWSRWSAMPARSSPAASRAETFGDYLAGSSHVLPTDGAARAWSGVSVHSFLKAISVQTVTRRGGARASPRPAAALARLEGLEAHARAADARLAEAAA